MKRHIYCILLLFYSHLGVCQNHNNFWISGNDGSPKNIIDTALFGGNIFDFNSNSLYMSKELRPMNFLETMGVGSDSSGQLLFYSNGTYIANVEHDTMKGGGPMNPGYWADVFTSWGDKGYRTRDGIIVVPDLNLPDHYRLFHTCISDSDLAPNRILTTLVDMHGDDGLGEVVEQNRIIYDQEYGRLSQSHFNATRHANGRDWWLASILYPSEEIMLHLYTPDSIYRFAPQAPLWVKPSAVGQCQFSPDGTKFASGHARKIGDNYESSIHYYLFDRCSGQFTPVFYDVQDDFGTSQVGVIFSATSRYLYQSYQDYIFRYDTEAPDVLASKDTVAEWDEFIYYTPGGIGFKVKLGYGELGADDVVYSNSSSTTAYMHKIEHADSEDGFEVTQHFKVPAIYAWTVPNFPNYFLGPLEGSPCAQMFGPPTALFAYEGQSLEIAFEDQSSGIPLAWHWDFGDGGISDEQHPEHVYMNQGTYTVCLTASNIYGGDMTCSDVMVKTSAVEPQLQQRLLEVYPNPVTDRIEIRFPDAEGEVYLYSVIGQLVATTRIHQGSATLSLEHCCSPGAYFVDVQLQNGIVLREKLIIR